MSSCRATNAKRKTTRSVHTLVCSAFYGSSPFAGAQVRHLDGNPLNNEPSNLAWGTQAENWSDRRAQGRGCEGEKHHAAKLSNEEREHVRWAVERGLCSQRSAARALAMSAASIAELMGANELRESMVSDPGHRIPRITLEITDVRVERLQDISEDDARAEGVACESERAWDGCGEDPYASAVSRGYHAAFKHLWESIHGPGSWARNDWVWAYTFRRIA